MTLELSTRELNGSIRENQPRRAPRGWLLVLCVCLVVFEPLGTAYLASTLVTRVAQLGGLTVAALLARLLLAGVAFAAGVAIWRGESHGVALATSFYVASLVLVLLATSTGALPSARAPSEARVFVAELVAYHLGCLAYLRWSRRVRNLSAP